jgi:proteasome accessory factor B
MPGRNTELIRQWTILRELATTRTSTIPRLAKSVGVTTRTVRRDLAALQAAGFPIEESEVNGSKFWRLPEKAMAGLQRTGLTLGELSALYLSRALFECFAESRLLADLSGALNKVDAALSPAMRKFLDRLPRALSAKSPHAKKQAANAHEITLRLLEATIDQRVVTMKYDSNKSGRVKPYVIHPYRIVHAQGGLYLVAYVPAYEELRTFAVERIRQASTDKATFEAVEELGSDPFSNSIGVYRGPTSRVQLRFDASIAQRVKERNWHASQKFKDHADGSTVMTLDVSDDYALRSWILGFGHGVRVLRPASLVEWAMEELDLARGQYSPGDVARALEGSVQPGLPFVFSQLTTDAN